jgi:anti-sigma B factor antagonist
MAPRDAHVLRAEIIDAPVPLVRATGELDLSTVAQLCHMIHTAATTSARSRLIVDLTGLEFCDSTGLRGLIGAIKEVGVLGGKAVVVVEPGGTLDRLLDLSGLREFLRVTDSVETARNRLPG